MGTMMACRTMGKNMMALKGGESFCSVLILVLKISGCIINVASLLGQKGGKGSAAYAASKAGVIGLSRALAAELGGKNVRVNVIVPGYIETDMTEGTFKCVQELFFIMHSFRTRSAHQFYACMISF